MFGCGNLLLAGTSTWSAGQSIGKMYMDYQETRTINPWDAVSATMNLGMALMGGYGAFKSFSSIPAMGRIKNAKGNVEPEGNLNPENGWGPEGTPNVEDTADPLDWSLVSKKGEMRTQHVQLHESNNMQKPDHGVLYGDSVKTINDAWAIKGDITPITQGNVNIYIIPKQNAGYAGGFGGQGQNVNNVTIINKSGTNQIITGFPGSGYTYDLSGLLP